MRLTSPPSQKKPSRRSKWGLTLLLAGCGFSTVLAQQPGQEPSFLSNQNPLFQKEKSVLAKANEPQPPSAANPATIPAYKGNNQFQELATANVARINFVGARRYDTAVLRNEISTREGQPFNQDKLAEDVRKLDTTHRYLVGVKADKQDTPDGVVINFYLVERSNISEVVYQGARHVGREELEAATGLRKGMAMAVQVNKRAAQAIEQMYKMKGRIYCQVTLLEGNKENDSRVVFQITEGPVVKISKINILGSNFVSSNRLAINSDMKSEDGNYIGIPMRFMAGEFQPAVVDADIARIVEWYKSYGYFDVKVNKVIRPTNQQESVELDIIVEEGQRFYVKDVKVAGAKQIDQNIILAHNTVKPNEHFTAKGMVTGLRAMNDEYGNRGIINTRISPEFNFHQEPGVVTVVYNVNEGPPPARVGDIKVVGNTVTKEEVIRRELSRAGVLPGQLISVPDMKVAERFLARMRIFKMKPDMGIAPRISILDPESATPTKDILVEVEEDATGLFQVGASIGADAGINGQITLNERNFDITRFPRSWDEIWNGTAFRGAGQDFRISAQPGNEFSTYSINWREPSIFDSDYSLDVAGYFFNRLFIEDHEQRLGANLGVGKRLDNAWSYRVGAKVETVKIGRVYATSPPDYLDVLGKNFLVAPQFSLIRDTRDDFLIPTEGSNLQLSLQYGLGDYSYPTITLEGSKYFTMYERPDGSGRHVLMFRGLVGWTGDDTPVYDRFFAGGSRSLRGFSFRGVGPDINGFKVGGNFQALGTVEYRVPLMARDNLFAVAFTDFGTVEKDMKFEDFRLSVGAGLRISLPQLSPAPIAIDWAFPLAKSKTDTKQVFQFYVGVAF